MKLNKVPQVHEVKVTCSLDSYRDYLTENHNTILFNNLPFIFFKKTTNYYLNTITFNLFFADMPSQDNFIRLIPNTIFSFSLCGLVYLENIFEHLEDFING